MFGDNVEDAMGPKQFLVFYLLCGLAAAALQTATNPTSAVPMVGAYARLYPRARICTLIFVMIVPVPAMIMLGDWLFIQIIFGLPVLGDEGSGVGFWAHIDGFACGLFFIGLFQRPEYVQEHFHLRR